MRLIDADKIGLTDFEIIMCNGDYKEALKMLLNKIDNAPTITQPEIIHCKDCKWSDWYNAADGHRYCYCMETGAAGRTANDFCSYAECEEASG